MTRVFGAENEASPAFWHAVNRTSAGASVLNNRFGSRNRLSTRGLRFPSPRGPFGRRGQLENAGARGLA